MGTVLADRESYECPPTGSMLARAPGIDSGRMPVEADELVVQAAQACFGLLLLALKMDGVDSEPAQAPEEDVR
jgi:hypothetical protein